MFNRKIIGIFLLLVMLLICVSAVSATDSETDDMKLAESPEEIQTTDNDEVLNAGESLYNEIENDDDGLIEIEGTYNESVSISKNITIRATGSGATFDGSDNPTLTVTTYEDTTVHLENILFTNANGTVLIHSWGNLFLKNCTFTNNFNKIIDCRGNLVVDSCKFLNNTPGTTSLVYAHSETPHNYTVSNTVFQTNHTQFSRDLDLCNGEIYLEDMNMAGIKTYFGSAAVHYDGCSIVNDTKKDSRAASYNNCIITNSEIIIPKTMNNTRLVNSKITKKHILNESITLSGCEFINSTIEFTGKNDYSNITIENTNFTGTPSIAIRFDNYNTWAVYGLYLKGCNFNDYESAISCKAINSGIVNCTFANGRHYAIKFNLNDTGIIDGCSFINLTSDSDGIISWTGPSRPGYYDPKYSEEGVVIGYQQGTAEYCLKGSITNSKFENIASEQILSASVNDFIMDGCYFKNLTGRYGAFVLLSGFNSTTTVSNCMFDTWNRSKMISSSSEKINIVNSTFVNGHASALYLNSDEFAIGFSNGKLITSNESFVRVENCNFSNTKSVNGFYGQLEELVFIYGTDGIVSGCEFTNNTCGHEAVELTYGGTLTQCAFINNTVEDGWLIFCYEVPKEISNCTFTGNTLQRNDIPIEGYTYFTCQQTGSYPGEIYLKITLYDKYSNKPIPNAEFDIDSDTLKTSNDGSVTYKLPSGKTGSSVLLIRYTHSETHPITIKKRGSLSIDYREMDYGSSTKLTVKLKDGNKKVVSNVAITIKVTVGKTVKTLTANTDKNGVAKFSVSKLGAGTHKFTVSAISKYGVKAVTSTLKIDKASPLIKAPKVKFKVKKSKYFKVKATWNSKGIKDLKLKLKIGKKIYTVKTDKSGVAKLNTKKLKVGKHKVIITSGNANYKINSKSQITIKR